MDLRQLWLVHWPKGAAGASPLPAAAVAELSATGLFLDTCLRQLGLGLAPRPALAPNWLAGADVLAGAEAWRFALEVATGLRSAVPGETNVFGQLKRAWATAPLAPERRRVLARTVDALFADTKALRRQHLQGAGGAGYGSLSRRLLAAAPGDRILLVGAGDLARSLLPFLGDHDVALWNHRPVAGRPGPWLAPVPGARLRWFEPHEAGAAADWARHVILTTPADAAHDRAWQARLAGPVQRGQLASVLHLGHRRADASPWLAGVPCFDLDDIFDLGRRQEQQRHRQLEAARAACAQLAAARENGSEGRVGDGVRPVLLAHG